MTAQSLDKALARLEDLPDLQLLEVADQLQRDMQEASRRWTIAKNELTRRLHASGATVIDAGDMLCQVDWTRTYTWDMDVVAEEAPQYTDWKPERVIPAERVVSNTRGLNEYIKKLGRTEKATRLLAARQVSESNPKFTFHRVLGGEE